MGGAKKIFKRVTDPLGIFTDDEKKSTPAPSYEADKAKAENEAAKKKKSMLNKGRSGTMLGGSVGSDDNLQKATLNGSDDKPKKQKLGD